MKTRSIMMVAGAAASLALAGAASAQCTSSKLLAPDRASSDFLGGALSGYIDISGQQPRVMIGSSSNDTPAGTNCGSVYVFGRINNVWGHLTQITAADGQPNDFFGVSVDAADPYAIVGATGVDDNGAVYFFERVGPDWVQRTKFELVDSQVGSDLGRAVAIDGTWAIAGVPLRDFDTGINVGIEDVNAGEVRFFQRQANGTWANTQTEDFVFTGVMAGQGAGDQFGQAVDLKGTLAVVGAPFHDNINWPSDHGIVHVYRRSGSTWTYIENILSFSANQDDEFGSSVATDGTLVAIGAPGEDASAGDLPPNLGAKSNCGSVYIYEIVGNAAVLLGRVFAEDASDNALFGSSVDINDDTLVVGAIGANASYLFKRNGQGDYVQMSRQLDQDTNGGNFGTDVALAGSTYIVGDNGDEELFSGLTNHGAAYAFTTPNAFAASDSCEGAQTISDSGTYSGCTFSATSMGAGATCGSGGTGADIWYAWTPACSGTYTINTQGSDFDTVLSLHSECRNAQGNNFTLICNDDGLPNNLSSLQYNAVAGTRYLIRVAGWSGAVGNFELNIVPPAAPTNDNCGPAAQVVSTGTHTFSTCQATDSPRTQSGCGPQGTFNNDVWFKFIAPVSGTATVDLCGSTFDTKLAVYGAPLCPIIDNTAIVCNDDQGPSCGGPGSNTLTSKVQFNTVSGQDYYIRVGGYSSSQGDVVMSITNFNNCPCDWNGVNGISVQDIYDFLSSWSAGNGDFNQLNGNTVQDIYDFLSCWSAGCP
jgi:hypothetical protein